MNEMIIPVGVLLLVGAVWLTMTIQCERLRAVFLKKYPKEAIRDIPYAFSRMKHPEKFLYFFRKKSYALLKADTELWKLRQRLVLLVWLSILVPVSFFVICGALMIISMRR